MNHTPVAPTISASAESAIDLSGFVEAAGGDEKEGRELLALFLEQIDSKIPKLQAALAGENLQETKVIAHSLAGAASTCGLMEFSRLLRDLELNASNNQLAPARAKAPKMENFAGEIAKAIREKLGR